MDRVAAGEHVVITRHGKPRIRLSPALAAPVACGADGPVARSPDEHRRGG